MILVAAGCSSQSPHDPETARPVKTLVVAAGEKPHLRNFPGMLEASKKVELAFQVSGLLVKFPVKEGQRVAKGEVIGQLRQDEFQARLKSLQGQLDQARAALRALQAGERPEQQLALDARLANARTEVDRARRLIERGGVSRSELEAAETTYRVAQEEHTAARQRLEQGMVAREEDIDAKEAAVRGLEGRVVEANIQLEDSTSARLTTASLLSGSSNKIRTCGPRNP